MTSTLSALHAGWAWVVIVGNGTAGFWALGASRWEGLRRRALWWFTGFAQVAMFVEVVLGVGLVAGEGAEVAEVAQFHMFYGFVALIAIAIIHSYRHQLRARLHLLYGFGGLFVAGLALRAVQIGP